MSYDWKQVVVAPSTTLQSALKQLDEGALRIVLVCDEAMHLQGVVTDGDVRRGLLRGVGLEAPVSQVMNTQPITVTPETSRSDAVALMQSKSILAIPVVAEGHVIGLQTLQKLQSTHSYQNPVFIMAGGFGTRLRPLTDNTPKPMLKVGERPILETLLLNFIKSGFSNFYISTHYLPHVIRDYFGDGSKWNVNITYVHEEEPLGTGGALGLLPESTPELPLIMVNGDVLTSVDFERVLDFHMTHHALATMCVREYDYQIPYGVIMGDGERIISMEEKPIQRFFVNAGIYVISPEIFKNVEKHTRIDMPTLLQTYLDANEDVFMFPIHEYWLDIGRMDDFKRAQIDIKGLGL
ncbi:nucleotidyltransferase family protein [Pseudidiomarina donghaiensis]|uniref:Alcohol dehydrogenase n=1 Tax=Pseudidiomarina donghaiensis TaxID=519452 RepID=A0A432XLC8_9GAMM|nr:nucleotidyltransferase family protein [Pseudidiomarina donghaiensis]RUO49513.1 alcohol dehydrogenase [Pseudidiomarina donghaiensis]SFV21397.1 CBS domain-containing protein [Pseudidiomarina donghaiensis]